MIIELNYIQKTNKLQSANFWRTAFLSMCRILILIQLRFKNYFKASLFGDL